MTVTIKDSNNQVIGTADSIKITTESIVETYQPADVVRDKEGNYVSSKPIGNPISFNGELLIKFRLINTSFIGSKNEEYNIQAPKGFFDSTEESLILANLKKCRFTHSQEGVAQGIFFTNPNSIIGVMEYYFPKLYIHRNFSDKVIGGFTESDFDSPSIEVNKFTEVYKSLLHLGDSDSIYLYESTDLHELMQITKQKLNKLFVSWLHKIN